MKLHRCMKYQF